MKKFILILILALIIPSLASAQASRKGKEGGVVPPEQQTICEAAVYFSWKRIVEPKTVTKPNGEQEIIQPDPALIEPIEVFYTRIGESAASEEQAKKALSSRLEGVQGQARARCVSLHENQSLCIKNRIDGLGSDYLTLDFAARKALLESIQKDCDSMRGICLSTRAEEILCAINTPPSLKTMEDKEKKSSESEEKSEEAPETEEKKAE